MPELNEVAENLKLSEEVKTQFEAGEITDLSVLLEDHNKNVSNSFLEAKVNSPEFIKPFKDQGFKEAEGKFKGTWEQQVSQIFPEISAKDDKGMRPFKDVLTDLKGIMDSKAKPDEKLREMQGKLVETTKAFEEMRQTVESGEHPTIQALKAELQAKTAEIENDRALMTLKSLKPDAITIPIDDWAFLLKRKLEERSLQLTRTDDGRVEFKTKDGLYPQNETGTEVIKDPRIIVDMLMGYATQKSNGNPNPNPNSNPNPNDPAVKISPNSHMARVQAKMAEQAKLYEKP